MAAVYPEPEDIVQSVPDGALAVSLTMMHKGVYGTLALVAMESNQIRDKLKSMWTTKGVVSALLLSMTYSSVLNPTLGGRSLTDPEVSDDAMARAFNMLSAFSSLGSLATIILATIFIIEIDLCCDADDIVEFVQRHQHMFELLLVVFSTSVLAILASMLVAIQYNLRESDPLTAHLITVVYCTCFALATVVVTWVRGTSD
ncbi:hypothetical protein V8C86DRAFT_2703840 [Haematococcus lacustris]